MEMTVFYAEDYYADTVRRQSYDKIHYTGIVHTAAKANVIYS